MPDTIIESVLSGKLDCVIIKKWLDGESIDEAPDDCILLCCTRNEFVANFLTYLRNQTDSILQSNSNTLQILQNSTPEKLLSNRRQHHRSISDPTNDERTNDSLTVKTEPRHESPNRDRKRTGRRVKTKLFEDKNTSNASVSSDESRISIGVDRIAISSTPLKNGVKVSEYPVQLASPVTPRSFVKDSYERCDTPRLSHRHSRSHEKSCLGDYLVTATKSSKKKTKKNTSNDDSDKVDLDLSNSEIFPEIGARKSSSLRSEKRRIKPTNIDKSQKSLSLNSFNSEVFQQPSPLALEVNSAFKHQKFHPKETSNSFETERSLLKQERHKLMEKFNILNTSTPAKISNSPQIKISRKESEDLNQNHIKADAAKILLQDKIDFLIEIYDILLKNNLILSINTELYFLISVLLSKQSEEDCLLAENQLKENYVEFLLRSIHNSTYFAVKSLWNQRIVLEVILDKNSLKTLGENKNVRSFYPELAKFLLNCYCARCERPAPRAAHVRAPAVIAYNCETDSVDNFPTTQAFHMFKKQRDAFYDIIRWYQETLLKGSSRSTLRARVKTLISSGTTATNHAHLAALFVAHMLASCLPSNAQESKLSKLQRRLTCPAAPDSHRLPHFSSNETFYKEFIVNAENESFRVHLRDALATEIVTLDSTHMALEDTGNTNKLDISRDYLQLAKKLSLLAKFLGYLTCLPYSQAPAAVVSKSSAIVTNDVAPNNREMNYTAPKDKVLESNIALRNYSQPIIDLKGILHNAYINSRMCITVPWLTHYLSMLDYTTLRLKYYADITKTLFDIYFNRLKLNSESNMKKNTIIYLKSILGWLFDLPHFPNEELKHSGGIVIDKSDIDIDSCDIVDEAVILELCPCLRDVNSLLSNCRLSQDQKEMGTFRHITPVSLSVNPEDRIKNKEKELQARLEEEMLKSQPSSTRRVLEMVIERLTSSTVKELSAKELPSARERAREQARQMLVEHSKESHAVLLQKTTQIYTAQLECLRGGALGARRAPLAARARSALAALLPAAGRHVHAYAARGAARAAQRWLNDHWNTTVILCKDIEAEMRTLISMNDMNIPPSPEYTRDASALAAPPSAFGTKHISVATPMILLKEHTCLLLEGASAPDVTSLLARCALSCAASNIFCRAPAQRAMLHLSVDLCVVYVSKQPKEITENFLNKFHAIWNTCCPDRKHYSPEELSLPERRDDISPVLRNFEDDERMATPISDEEADNSKTVFNGDSQPIISNSHPIDPKIQPISSRMQATGSRSQPISPKLQPMGSNSQPFSPRSQPISPKWQPMSSNSQPISPKWQPTGSISQPISPKVQPSRPKLQPSPSTSQILATYVQPITPTSQPIVPKVQPITPTSQPCLSTDSTPTEVKNDQNVTQNVESNEHLLEFFDRILCPRNIVLLSMSRCEQSEVWEALASVLVFLLKNDYLSEDSLTEQCLAVYRQDWPQNILENLSTCMKSVSSRWSRSSTGKFTLFLDFLAEYCGDMDYEPLE